MISVSRVGRGVLALVLAMPASWRAGERFPADPGQQEERTSFQSADNWSPQGNLRSDVALVYGFGGDLAGRIAGWRERGYRIHFMTGVSWGRYHDFLDGGFDGKSHRDWVQKDRDGNDIIHDGDVVYLCPSVDFARYLIQGIQRALDAGVEAVCLEEPEFWARAGWSEGFKREWRDFYQEDWVPPESSPEAMWRASRLKAHLYERTLRLVFEHVAAFNREQGKAVRCYVATHSLLNYAHWRGVSPGSALSRLEGCDGYIAQVWTGTSRTPNVFLGERKERTFETAFLEYGAMASMVKGTGRRVWFLNDPVEDNPNHGWADYRANWESTLVASLLHPDVWRFEVAPWPERIFAGRYPQSEPPERQSAIPPEYAVELQVVMNALNDMNQPEISWDCGTAGVGVLVSDSLMWQRERPVSSDADLSHVYGLALPLVSRGLPVTPVQLENAVLTGFLDGMKVLLLSYHGQKPLSPEVHDALVRWVKAGGSLIFVDDDGDPFNQVREWWNENGKTSEIPRRHLFQLLGLADAAFEGEQAGGFVPVEQGTVGWIRERPEEFARSPEAAARLREVVKKGAESVRLAWRETRHLSVRRGPYVVGAGLESEKMDPEDAENDSGKFRGRFIRLFDPELREVSAIELRAGRRELLLDLDRISSATPTMLASACKAIPAATEEKDVSVWTVEGVGGTRGIALIRSAREVEALTLEGGETSEVSYEQKGDLIWVRFGNEARPRTLRIQWKSGDETPTASVQARHSSQNATVSAGSGRTSISR